MKKLLLFFCLLPLTGLAKTPRPDSLKRVLVSIQARPPGHSKDTLMYATMKEIMRSYTETSLDSSLYYNKLIINFCLAKKLDKDLTYAYLYAGYLYSVKRNFYQSIDVHYKALTLAKKLNQHARIARALGGLAHAYLGLEKNEKALEFGRQGLALLEMHPDPNMKASILNDIGAIYRKQGKLGKALAINQDLYTLAKKNSLQWHEAQGLQAIGWVYKDMGDMAKALRFSLDALDIVRQKRPAAISGRIDLEANIMANIGDIYIRQQKWPQALHYCMPARQTAIATGNGTLLTENEEQLYKIYKHTGQTANALKAYEHFVLLKDSLAKGTNEQRIEMLSAQYKYEQSQNELLVKQNHLLSSELKVKQLKSGNRLLSTGIVIILVLATLLLWNNRRLKARNRKIEHQRLLIDSARTELADMNRTLENRVDERTKELVDANNELIRKNEEIKAALFKGQTIERKRVALELHDNLSSLLSAVNMNMQSINPQNLPATEQMIYRSLKQLIQNAYAEVRNISHNILPADLEKEGLAVALTRRIEQFNQTSALRIDMVITGLDDRLPAPFEVNIYSIVHELVNNAIRHAQASTLTIRLLRSTTDINLSVKDDGIGLGPQTPKRGVGFQNIQTRLDSLGGTLTIMQPVEKGTWIDIKIPVDMV